MTAVGEQAGPARDPGGRWRPGASARRERTRASWRELAGAAVDSPKIIAVFSPRGGVGKTTTAVHLGHALAMARSDLVIAVDANPDFGNLVKRISEPHSPYGIADLCRAAGQLVRYSDLMPYVTQAPSGLWVVRSDLDPAARPGPGQYRLVLQVLSRYASVIVVDLGTGIREPAFLAVAAEADALVAVAEPAGPTAEAAADGLDWIREHLPDRTRSAFVVMNAVRSGQASLDAGQFAATHAVDQVFDIPHDPHLAVGDVCRWALLSPHTQDAYLRLSAAIMDSVSDSAGAGTGGESAGASGARMPAGQPRPREQADTGNGSAATAGGQPATARGNGNPPGDAAGEHASPPTAPGSPQGAAVLPRRRWRRGGVVGITAIAAACAAAAVGVPPLIGKPESAVSMALQAGRAIARAPGLTFTGTIRGARAMVTVTRAGTVAGSYALSHYQVSRITIDGETYFSAPAAFWVAQSISRAAARQAAGKWAQAPARMTVTSFAALTPGQIARTLSHPGRDSTTARTTLDGTSVVRISSKGIRYYITTASPSRLIHLGGGGSAGNFSLGVSALTARSIRPVFTTLRSDVRGLQGAAVPAATVKPGSQTLQFQSCTDKSCTAFITVSVADPASSRVLLTMTIDFSDQARGPAAANCTSTVPVYPAASASVPVSCGVSGGAWTRWYNGHSAAFLVHARSHFTVTVNTASDVAAMQSELNSEQLRSR